MNKVPFSTWNKTKILSKQFYLSSYSTPKYPQLLCNSKTSSEYLRHISSINYTQGNCSTAKLPGELQKLSKAQLSTTPGNHDLLDNFLCKLNLSPKQLERGTDFNRLLLIPAACINHLCLGSIFAWSVFNQPLMRNSGVLAPAASDWLLSDVTTTFSLVMGGFAWGAVFSKYLDRLGPRTCSLLGAVSLGSGFTLASFGVSLHSLPLLYTGGLVWGLANGFAYIPPVACLLKWFPERKGLASGLCLVGYGAGAMLAAPLFSKALDKFKRAPTLVSNDVNSVDLVNQSGKLFVEGDTGLREVIVATDADVVNSGFEGVLDAGVYFVGTGSTGVSQAFLTLGALYGLTMTTCAYMFRLPNQEVNFKGDDKANVITKHNVEVSTALKTPQFWLLYAGFVSSITGAYGLLSCGKILLAETQGSLPIVTPEFTVGFVAAMSAANLTGRLFYTSFSDFLAFRSPKDPFFSRRLIYNLMFGITIPSYASIIWAAHNPSQVRFTGNLSLFVFGTSVFMVLGSFGGTAATRPAIVGDLFGLKNVAALSAIQLSAVLPAAYLGPKVVTKFREHYEKTSLLELSERIPQDTFLQAFGGDKSMMNEMIESKTITLSRVLDILPPETTDPSPYMYDSSLKLMAGLNVAAIVASLLVKPVDPKLHSRK
eukprot:maker-scaffold_12-snap-gene-10.58-mRNA-1 protein AED:0.21 eAED:0.21 QI:0/0.66/0.25/1/1/1/4/101/653